ncbi:HEPN domain-containing protein [Vulcanisaeta sp. JCM 14467]|uniref:HEPN domain-containing protein n=1 Tax=Vulcanisaeta sp. JCM 14467 TaxID=1295370 RepID=UPI0006D0CC63|nr:HEPN domain-containing protein [Vulcanisaeta sp. JCM 14467]
MEYQKWFAQALRDLRTAENSLNSGDYYACAFWSQQAVEKALKALLISRGKVVRGHDLVELGYIIRDELHMDVSQIMDNLRELTTHYTTARYPDAANGVPYEIYTEGMARRILEKAREVMEWVRQNLQ